MKSLRELTAVVGVVTAVSLVALNYRQLPERIATHFNAAGMADGYGSRSALWLLAAVAVGTYGVLSLVNFLPRKVNVGRQLTAEQESRVWGAGMEMVGWVKAEVAWMFAYLSYSMVGDAMRATNGLGPWFMPAVVIAMMGTMAVFGVKMLRGMRAV